MTKSPFSDLMNDDGTIKSWAELAGPNAAPIVREVPIEETVEFFAGRLRIRGWSEDRIALAVDDYRHALAYDRKHTQKRRGILFDVKKYTSGLTVIKLADKKQSINGILQLPIDSISDMEANCHNLDYQLSLCCSMMNEGDILPYPFERAVILLRKAKLFEDELNVCLYIKEWCEVAERKWNGRSAKTWKSPSLIRCIERIPKIEALIAKQK